MASANAPASSADRTPDTDEDVPWHNRVVLRGRLSAVPEPVELPSGDPLWRFRVTVERPPVKTARRADGTPRRIVDAVDCATGAATLAHRLGRLPVGAVVEVEGTLTRRFWRSAGGPASRYEVVVDRVAPIRRSRSRAVAGVA